MMPKIHPAAHRYTDTVTFCRLYMLQLFFHWDDLFVCVNVDGRN